MSTTIEYADNFQQEQRLVSAYNSLQRCYKRRHKKLIDEDLKLRMEAGKEKDPAKRAELTKQIEVNGKEIEKLNNGMLLCRQNDAFDKDNEKVTLASASEQRIATTATPGLMQDYYGSDIGQKLKLHGVAAVKNTWTDINGFFKERIAQGAFTECLSKGPDCRLLKNHDPNLILGRTKNGTLRLYDTRIGLEFWGDMLSESQLSVEVWSRVRRGDLSGCSFAFTVAEDDWTLPTKPGLLPERTILKIVDLYDVGPVTYPAYETTSVEAVTERSDSCVDEEFLRFAETQEDDPDLREAAIYERKWLRRNEPVDERRQKLLEQRLRLAELRLKCF